ncbi:fimbrial biogenesis outer membrane usher protein, partial [Pseudomonas chlororaphis]|nr:fimbrial biogenesis outer membrane usher protein [Pseudomonas chlororaphis]
MTNQSVVVKDGGKDNALKYCFKASHVKQWGVDASKLPDQEKVQKLLASDCVEPGELIPQAAFEMDIGSLSGRLSIPQAYAGKVLRNYVAPEDWDSGINAGFVSYNGNAYRTQSDQGSSSTEYNVGLNSGVNIGEWRLRHNGNYRNTDYGSKYQAMNSYAQADV